MIIDPTEHFHQNYRPYTAKAAVAGVLAEIKVGSVLQISGFIDPLGRNLPLNRLQTLVNKCKGDAVFQTRQAPAPMMATIRRIA